MDSHILKQSRYAWINLISNPKLLANMNFIIDGTIFTKRSSGIPTFSRCLLKALAKHLFNDVFFIIMPKTIHESINRNGYPENVHFCTESNCVFSHLPNLFWRLFMMPFIGKKYHADVYFSPSTSFPFLLPKKIRKIAVVHDVVNLEFGWTMNFKSFISAKIFFNHAIRKADLLWANSNYTKDKIEEYYPERKCKRIFVGGGVDKDMFKKLQLTATDKDRQKVLYGISGAFALFVGTLEPRKNLKFLLHIWPELYKKHSIKLVVVGGSGWKNSEISDIINSDDIYNECIIFCNYIPDEELVKLYNTAACYVSASLNEGFGMPQLEAMLCGCPVVTANNSAMAEVAEHSNLAKAIDGYDPDVWRQAIADTISNPPKEDAPHALDCYDWDIIADSFVKSFE